MILRHSFNMFFAVTMLLNGAAMAQAQQTSDPRVEDLQRAGRVRIAMFPPQFTKNTSTGELGGWGIELARALGTRLEIEVSMLLKNGPDGVLQCLKEDLCDAGFLVNSPAWAHMVDFSRPFLEQDFTLLVPNGSEIRSVADVDRPEVRVAVVRNHGSTLALARVLKQAKMVTADTLDSAFALLRDGKADAFASTRPQLLDDSRQLPGSVVLDERYGVNFSVLAVPKAHAARLAYVNEFLREAGASGLLHRAIIEHAGWRGVRVMSP